jgi:hypothetical protein
MGGSEGYSPAGEESLLIQKLLRISSVVAKVVLHFASPLLALARVSHQRLSRGGVGAVLTRRRDRGARRRTRAVRRARRPSATQSGRMATAPQQKVGEKFGLAIC